MMDKLWFTAFAVTNVGWALLLRYTNNGWHKLNTKQNDDWYMMALEINKSWADFCRAIIDGQKNCDDTVAIEKHIKKTLDEMSGGIIE